MSRSRRPFCRSARSVSLAEIVLDGQSAHVSDELRRNVEGGEEDRAIEARRFASLLPLLQENVPELVVWKREDALGDELDSEALGLSEAWILVNGRLFDNDGHPVEVDGIWPRLLAVIEVAIDLGHLLFDDERDDDGIAVSVFAGSGIMCDITRNVASPEALLPWMGPACVKGARTEVNNHTTSRGYGIDDVDWSNSGVAYRPLAVSVLDLVPARRS